jgi:hypothetical protein
VREAVIVRIAASFSELSEACARSPVAGVLILMNYSQILPKTTVIVALFGTIALAACNEQYDRVMASRGVSEEAPMLAQTAAGSAEARAVSDQSTALAPRLIKQAAAHVEVSDLDKALQSTGNRVQRVSGRVVESGVTTDDDVRSAHLLIRVPADALDSLLAQLADLGDVRSVTTSSMDVSREYLDTETRLRVKEETVRRMMQLIQRSARVEDLVAVERELSRVTAELESLKGQIQYFDRKVAESDLRLQLVESKGGLFAGSLRPVSRALRDTGRVLAQSVATLVHITVFVLPWLLTGLLLWWLGRRVLRARQRKA